VGTVLILNLVIWLENLGANKDWDQGRRKKKFWGEQGDWAKGKTFDIKRGYRKN